MQKSIRNDQQIQELEIKVKTRKRTCTFNYHEIIQKLFIFNDENLIEDLSNIKLTFRYIMSLIILVDVSDLEKVESVDDFFRIYLYYSSKVQWFVKGFYYLFCSKNVPFLQLSGIFFLTCQKCPNLQPLTRFTKCVFLNIYLKLIQIQVTYAILLTKIY